MVMSKVFVEDTEMQDIANAIREKNGTDTKYLPSEMSEAIDKLEVRPDYLAIRCNDMNTYVNGQVVINPSSYEKFEYSSDKVYAVSANTFSYCNTLTKISLPNCEKFDGINQFQNCSILEEVNIPKLKNLTTSSFSSCAKLKELILRNLEGSAARSSVNGCSSLELLDLGNISKIEVTALNGNKKMKTLILRSDSVVALEHIANFSDSPFSENGDGGTVYVKQALIEEYKTATNWSVVYGYGNCEFRAIEGSEYE